MDAFIGLLIRIVETMFVVGVFGSAFVWILTAVELLNVLKQDENPATGEMDAPNQSAT
jgi:hypothetical protein